jgi:mannonate dehydratase
VSDKEKKGMTQHALPPTGTRPRISLNISSEATPEELAFARAVGAECAYVWVRNDQRDLAFLTALKKKVEDAGLTLYMVGNMAVGKSDKIHLALPGRDEMIAAYQAFIENLGRAGIGVTTFTWEPDQVWSSEPGESRGATARRVDMAALRQRPYTHERAYTEAELWDNFAYFMERIIPVAERAGVRLALHPNDPPTSEPLGGIPCIIRSAAAYRKAYQIANSKALGMEFCWLEGGSTGFGDVLAGIREFQADGRILIVHFRNVSATLPDFTETFLDNGYMDMYQVMKTLVEVGYTGTVTFDHTPRLVGDYAKGGGPGFATGYMRALLNCATRE